MAGSEEGLAASLGELRVEASPLRDSEIAPHGNGADIVDDDDDIWDDAGPDSPGRRSILDREWVYSQNQFPKMGYRDGITEGQKDAAQEGFNICLANPCMLAISGVFFGGLVGKIEMILLSSEFMSKVTRMVMN